MNKLSIAGSAVIGAIVITIGADARPNVKQISPARNSNAREDSISSPINDPELLEYFEFAGHARQLNEGEGEGVSEDENEQYHNYVEKEAYDHYQELMTEDDDDVMNFFVDDLTIPPGGSVTIEPTEPTEMPTFSGSSLWECLDGYEVSLSEDFYGDEHISMYSEDEGVDHGENTIRIKMSMGVVNVAALSENERKEIINMAFRTITNVLNDYSEVPFVAHDHIEYFDYNDRNRNLQTECKEKPINFGDILLLDTIIHDGHHGWWELWGTYGVYKNPQRGSSMVRDTLDDRRQRKLDHRAGRRKLVERVENEKILSKIEGICNNAIMQSMSNGLYWTALRNVDYGNHDLLLAKGIYYKDDKGIIDCKAVGDEYDLAPLYCPMQRPQNGNTKECPVDPLEIGNVTRPAENQAFVVPVNTDTIADPDPTYPEVIAKSLSDIEWGNREWVGFALMISTVVWTLILSVTAHLIFKRRKTQILWGTALTPNGVDDILKVGWRVYEQPQEQEPSLEVDEPPVQQHPQLFLQIYDKGQGPGYNEENSILQGGVEQPQIFAAPPLQNRPENIQPP